MVAKILDRRTRRLQSGPVCGVQIIADGTGAAEALIALNESDEISGLTNISQVLALTPCLVPTFLNQSSDDSDSSHHRRLENMTNLDGNIRELHETFMSERERELSEGEPARRDLSSFYYNDYNTTYRSSYWDRTERYCDYYQGSCFNYCDWYPSYCGEFCYWFPYYCKPA